MSRRSQAPRRNVLADPKYGNEMLARFVNMVMKSGKKSVAEKIVYGAIDRIAERSGADDQRALELLSQALENIKPAVEVKSRRVGGATYQIPVEISGGCLRQRAADLVDGRGPFPDPASRRQPAVPG